MKHICAKKGSHLTFEERQSVAVLHDEGLTPYKIGKILGRASNTIRNELKRGTITIIAGYYEKEKYFPDTGQAVYEKNRKRCKMPRKIETCRHFISYVEEEVVKHKRSFSDIRAEVLDKEIFKEDEICSVGTLYSYIEKNMLKIKNIDLLEKVRRRPQREQPNRKHKRLKGTSISERPDSINNREEFGHWEIDCVIGKNTAEDRVLLTLTERKSRKEIIRKIKNKNIKSVHRCLDKLKREIPCFKDVFKTITTDNGSEFAQLYQWGAKNGIDIYYAHPYSSWERGQNENGNRIIRRFVPKGEMIRDYTKKDVQEVETRINTLYRKSLGWKTADMCFREELEQLFSTTG